MAVVGIGVVPNTEWLDGSGLTIDDGVVFAIGTQGRLLAANKDTGAPLWQHDLVREYAADLPSYGYSSSPLVAGGKLFLAMTHTDSLDTRAVQVRRVVGLP